MKYNLTVFKNLVDVVSDTYLKNIKKISKEEYLLFLQNLYNLSMREMLSANKRNELDDFLRAIEMTKYKAKKEQETLA